MKTILIILLLSVGFINAQVTGKVLSDIESYGGGVNSTHWIQQYVFVDSGATRIGPFSSDEPPIAIAITRNAVWDSVTATPTDDYHWDSSWTASDLSFLLGYRRDLNDSARTTISTTDSIDFLPSFDEDGLRYYLEADSMRVINIEPIDGASFKYFYVEFYNSTTGALVAQTEPRTMILTFRRY